MQERNVKKRNCQKGRPCGFTCIDPTEICRKELGDSVSNGLSQVARDVSSRDKLQSDYASHVASRSFSLPDRKFGAMDLANAVIEASNQLQGEAKENFRKMMDFVVRDGQGLLVSTNKVDYDRDASRKGGLNAYSGSWIRSPELERLMGETSGKVNPLNTVKRLEVSIEKLRETESRMLEKIKVLEDNGQDAKVAIQTLLETRKELRMKREALKNPDYAVAEKLIAHGSITGFTSSGSRYVVLSDSYGFDKGKPVDANLLSSQVQKTMEQRANWANLTPEQKANTHSIFGGLRDGSVERVLGTYVHELGHQIHYRSGIEDPPYYSATLKRAEGRGLSGYSNASYRETFAEAFAAFVFNPTALKQQDSSMYNWVQKNLDLALRNAGSKTLVPF